MKKVRYFLFFFGCFFSQMVYSQTTEIFKVGSNRFINPSINQIIRFLEMDYYTWEKVVTKYGYEKITEPNEPVIYSKGEIGEIVHAISKTDRLVSIDWWNFKTNLKTLTSVKKKIDKFYIRHENDIDFYSYQGYIIGISTLTTEKYSMERILIKKQ